ncbi:DUF4255 domain-containing protein [Anthocerotibacter panamensis]|uniref:DUF4255 domain-containing protein n=1 Tax=Anthocerotibacter panamensis TaxID=2857077 RepID=UPI001C403819|nr:DUF4255 domain-containing protein [Anthocerotibacter panamensis]
MSNHLAIATVTATLQRVLQASVQADVDGATVTTLRPDASGSGTPESRVNVYLYQAAPVVWRNADLPTRHGKGEFVKRPQTALDLFYIVSFYGNETELEPQRLLGSVVRTLHSRPVLTQEMIRDTVADATFSYLGGSNLLEQIDLIKFTPTTLTTDELSKIWSVFFQTAYTLSIAYKASTVLIESDDTPQRALPVRDSRLRVTPSQVRIDHIAVIEANAKLWHQSKDQLILMSSTLQIKGKGLLNDRTLVRVGGVDVEPSEVKETQVTLSLTNVDSRALRSGAQGIQIIHRYQPSPSPGPERILESNVLAFILRPTIIRTAVDRIEGTGNEPDTIEVTLQVNPMVGRTQRLALVLNERSTEDPAAYTFMAPPRAEDSATVSFRVPGVKRGLYLARVQVDGAESLLRVDQDAESPTFEQYIGPTIEIS